MYAVLLFVYCSSLFKAIERSTRNLVLTLCWRTSYLRNENMMDVQVRKAGAPVLLLVRVSTFMVTYLAKVRGICEANVPVECEIARRHTY